LKELQKIIESNSGERAIQNYLKSNLSIIGKAHSFTKGEYIVISELPVGEGSVILLF